MSVLIERLKESRKKSGLSQSQLAEKIGVQTNTVWRWENGRASPMESIMNLAIALNTTVAYLIGESDNPEPEPYLTSAEARLYLLQKIREGVNAGVLPKEDLNIKKDELKKIIPDKIPAGGLSPEGPRPVELIEVPCQDHRTWVGVLPKDFATRCGKYDPTTVKYDNVYFDINPELSRYPWVVAMYAKGDSMAPDIEEDDMVIFTENDSDLENAPNGSIIVADYEGRMIVRGLFVKRGKLILKAWNKDYDDIEAADGDDLSIVGLVLRVDKSKKPRQML
jgi:transcriptional regulator with XRE-family HTH domain